MKTRLFKIIAIVISFCFLFEQSGFAQVAAQLDISSYIAGLGRQVAFDKFRPLHLRSLGYDQAQNNFQLLLDKGDAQDLSQQFIRDSTHNLLQYFLVGVTLPNSCFWVNLKPDAPDNVIEADLARTEVGRVLLEADLQLKKDTAKATSPETAEGKKYWELLYKKAEELFGNDNVTIPTLVRPWIVPDEIIIRESDTDAYIYKATLKVMLEEDYLKNSGLYSFKDPRLKALNAYSAQLIREKIIPKLTREVNVAKRYASLRQVYYSLILAQWFKSRLAGKANPYSALIDRRNLTSLIAQGTWSVRSYFEEYRKSFQEGEYNLKENIYTPYGQNIRTYTSGGINVEIGFGAVPEMGKKNTISNPVRIIDLHSVKPLAIPGVSENLISVTTAGNDMQVSLNEEPRKSSPLSAANAQIKQFVDRLLVAADPYANEEMERSEDKIATVFGNKDNARNLRAYAGMFGLSIPTGIGANELYKYGLALQKILETNPPVEQRYQHTPVFMFVDSDNLLHQLSHISNPLLYAHMLVATEPDRLATLLGKIQDLDRMHTAVVRLLTWGDVAYLPTTTMEAVLDLCAQYVNEGTELLKKVAHELPNFEGDTGTADLERPDNLETIGLLKEEMRAPGAKKLISLDSWLQNAVAKNQTTFKSETHVTISLVYSETGVNVNANLLRLYYIVNNLIANSVKSIRNYRNNGHNEREGNIEVSYTINNGFAEITVIDNGEGMEEYQLKDRWLFKKGNTTRQGGWGGEGLALVEEVLKLYDGTVDAFSDGPGKGAKFTVRLPIIQVSSPVRQGIKQMGLQQRPRFSLLGMLTAPFQKKTSNLPAKIVPPQVSQEEMQHVLGQPTTAVYPGGIEVGKFFKIFTRIKKLIMLNLYPGRGRYNPYAKNEQEKQKALESLTYGYKPQPSSGRMVSQIVKRVRVLKGQEALDAMIKDYLYIVKNEPFLSDAFQGALFFNNPDGRPKTGAQYQIGAVVFLVEELRSMKYQNIAVNEVNDSTDKISFVDEQGESREIIFISGDATDPNTLKDLPEFDLAYLKAFTPKGKSLGDSLPEEFAQKFRSGGLYVEGTLNMGDRGISIGQGQGYLKSLFRIGGTDFKLGSTVIGSIGHIGSMGVYRFEKTLSSPAVNIRDLVINKIKKEGGISFHDFMEITNKSFYENSAFDKNDTNAWDTFAVKNGMRANKEFTLTMARQLLGMWNEMGKPADFPVVEMGAGTGYLAARILQTIKEEDSQLYQALHYIIIENSSTNIETEKATLEEDGVADWPKKMSFEWGSAYEMEKLLAHKYPEGITGVFISNELLDDFPVHLVRVTADGLKEVYIKYENEALNEELREVPDEYKTEVERYIEDLRKNGLVIENGREIAVNLNMLEWLKQINRLLKRGYVITVDYYETDYKKQEEARDFVFRNMDVVWSGAHRGWGREQIYQSILENNDLNVTAEVNLGYLGRRGEEFGLEFISREKEGPKLGFMLMDQASWIERLLYAGDMDIENSNWDKMKHFNLLIQGKNVERPLTSTSSPVADRSKMRETVARQAEDIIVDTLTTPAGGGRRRARTDWSTDTLLLPDGSPMSTENFLTYKVFGIRAQEQAGLQYLIKEGKFSTSDKLYWVVENIMDNPISVLSGLNEYIRQVAALDARRRHYGQETTHTGRLDKLKELKATLEEWIPLNLANKIKKYINENYSKRDQDRDQLSYPILPGQAPYINKAIELSGLNAQALGENLLIQLKPMLGAPQSENEDGELSSPLTDKKSDRGGIDFRALPITTQPIPAGMSNALPLASQISVAELDKEWQEIQNMIKAGIVPSSERIKEYAQASCRSQNLDQELAKVVSCIADILRLEEEKCVFSEAALTDLLMALESSATVSAISNVLGTIEIIPKAPKGRLPA